MAQPSLTTTTTLPVGGCNGIPDGPAFASIECRLQRLRDQASGDARLDGFAPKLAHTLDKALGSTQDAQTLCAASNVKKAKTRLKKVNTALTQYTHRLKGLPAKKKLDPDVRTTYLAAAPPIVQDLATLKSNLACPGDAGA